MAKQVTYEDLLRIARGLNGQTIPTIGGRATFTVAEQGERIAFIPTSSGKPRNLGREVHDVITMFNETGSLQPGDYTAITQNSVYILALISRA